MQTRPDRIHLVVPRARLVREAVDLTDGSALRNASCGPPASVAWPT
ncbi:hypothetical protein NX794_04250 [Streptomyces sp. LP11]|uniref:Uncharacterized protein n=1 Tax=Streptomyces pyxinicus TaxID=2970331 RepID=A0ABT2AW22_9ACTN|nr:hypothetical protein [Streptomyces sp. LP11]MCS0600446.1 hypothetical protein [Streptomyces sp. LP11]